jgi:hypothetical protein
MKSIIYLLVVVLLFESCAEDRKTTATGNRYNKLDTISWFIGSWQQEDSGNVFTEAWSRQNDSVWVGTGQLVTVLGDTAFSEALQLVNIHDTLWYVPTIGNQNNGQPVRFMEKEITDTSIVFENLSHDFPQRIIYIRENQNEILARVEGMVNGRLKTEEFALTHK